MELENDSTQSRMCRALSLTITALIRNQGCRECVVINIREVDRILRSNPFLLMSRNACLFVIYLIDYYDFGNNMRRRVLQSLRMHYQGDFDELLDPVSD